jgi:hypothetical protein
MDARWLVVLALAAGCDNRGIGYGPGSPVDGGGAADLRSPPDSGYPIDLARAIDLAHPIDLALPIDLARGADAGMICGGLAGVPCPSGSFCQLPANTCLGADFQGTCTAIPQVCDQIYAPVCGCDGVTYGNDCERLAATAQLDHAGACAGAHCSSDSDCGPGLLCCYPCGIPGCTNQCMAPASDGKCPLFP